ncbi:DUF3159 domain-containing protein [Umezawaea sp. NPDC059074]|uniref:DUF3159 domain-containing protein n=1 Tax=Umezawaea sp. NPDC059074 TaxID=3346716 RepID=UPI0036D12431
MNSTMDQQDLRTATTSALSRFDGASGLAVAAAPSVAFGVLSTTVSTTAGLVAAAAVSAATVLWRLARRASLKQAVVGVALVAVYSAVVLATGEAKNYFLVQSLTSVATVLLCLASVAVRWPLAGVLLNRIVGGRRGWRENATFLRLYTRATLACAGVAAVTSTVQVSLYLADRTALLAAVTSVDGPLWGVVAAAIVVVARKAVREDRVATG